MSNALFYLLIFLVAYTGYYLKSLTISGGIAAFFIGVFISLGLQGKGLVLLGVFFVTSSLWSKYKKNAKGSLEDLVEKGDKRDFGQVLANGLLPALVSFIYWIFPSDYWLYAFCFSIAAANSDTWASEIGALSNKLPFHIRKLKAVAHGTSGAVSLLGLFASFVGALLIGTTAYVVFEQLTLSSLIIITIVGFLGSLIDTVIGASIQAKYTCTNCELMTEKTVHCERVTQLISGFKWMNNDVTNFISILLASSIGVVFI
jgi:uncharacterized protein (TIGR00297 family)